MAPSDSQEQHAASSGEKLKRPQSAYFLFAAEVKPGVIAKQKAHSSNEGKVDITQVSKEISSLWAQAGVETKAKYEAMAAQAKAKHEAAKALLDPVAAMKAKYASLIPKKPLGPWMLFTQDPANRKNAEEALKKEEKVVTMGSLTSKLSEMWKLLAPEEKVPLEELHKKAIADFEEKRKSWEATPEFAEYSEVQKKASMEKKKRKRPDPADSESKSAENEGEATSAQVAAKTEAPKPKRQMRTQKAKSSEHEAQAGTDPKVATKTETPTAEKKARIQKAKVTEPQSDIAESKVADSEKKTISVAETVTPEKQDKKTAPPRTVKAPSKPEEPEIDEKVLNEARSIRLELEYRNLRRRPEVKNIPDQELLDALQLCDGLVNRAKDFVLHPVARFISMGGQ